ncbi:family 16 glycosylhydrolase [uncultured Aquimarina sp.]|uniref:family 16 glycosylhydrolase n=1 Tax=uncultured Aquimarina sp. TaxID=575652 RepID=UPI0026069FEC|nr:family 16 glycosylhydrolase [uncultured Aquimarina sp.]
MKNLTKFLVTACMCLFFGGLLAQPTPPNGKKWEKIESMSDEFNGSSLNGSKWAVNDPQWEGRRPARFETFSVSVGGGDLKISASKKSNAFGGWTHNGGLVRSKTRQKFGYYETRMKANKTFMSSTFWLINKRNEFTGCNARVTELDVTENVGANTGGKPWINQNMRTLNANTHSRNTSCNSTPTGIRGNKAEIGEFAYQGYHTYGVWWKNEKELLFYLDGKFVFQITPAADFSLPMYLRMVVETYDWNPPKAGQDGMNDSQANRTTYYDWVRSYRLVDGNGNSGPGTSGGNVTIKGQSNNRFISSENGNRSMTANKTNAGSWEKFTVTSSGNGTVTIKGNNGRFVSSENGTKAMNCNRTAAQGWEKFTLVSQGGNVYAIKGNNGKYVSHENGANSGITCNRSAIGAWEKFIISGLNNRSFDLDTKEVSKELVDIYPNPASNISDVSVDIQLEKDINTSIKVMDIRGRVVLAKNLGVLKAGNTSIPLNDLGGSLKTTGLYLIKINVGNKVINKKLMVN